MKLTRKLLLEMIEEETGSRKQYPEFKTSGGGNAGDVVLVPAGKHGKLSPIKLHKKYTSDDFCSHYGVCQDGLGKNRETEMPQVKDSGDFSKELSDPPPGGLETNEPQDIPDIGKATPDYLDSSDDVGAYPKGDQVGTETVENIDPGKLHPTQADTYIHNALGKVLGAEKSPWNPWDDSVLISKDWHLLDGHHRWAATIIYNERHPNDKQTMTVQQVDVPIAQLLKIANAYTDAKGTTRPKGGGTIKEAFEPNDQIEALLKQMIDILKDVDVSIDTLASVMTGSSAAEIEWMQSILGRYGNAGDPQDPALSETKQKRRQVKLTKKLLEQMIQEAVEDAPQQWLSPDVEEDDVDLDKDDWNIGDPEPLRDWLNDILIRRVQDALRDAAEDIAEEVNFDKEYKEHLLDTVGINIEEDLLDFLRPVAELLADGNQKYPDPLDHFLGVALRNTLSENKIEEGDVIDLGAEREKRASEKEREEVAYIFHSSAEVEEKASELAQSVLVHLLENKFVEIGEPPYGENDPVVVLVDGIRESLKDFLLSQGGGLSEGVSKESGKNHAQVSEAQFQMARADMESKMLEDAAKNILNVLLLKHKLSKEDQQEYKEDIKSGIENIIKMLRREMVYQDPK